jgi:hypothetical protein
MKHFLVFTLFIISTISIFSQTTFEKKYKSSISTGFVPVKLIAGNNDDIYMASITPHATITHLNSFGDTLWTRGFYCPSCSYNLLWLDDFIKTKDGNLIIAGRHSINFTTDESFVLKVDTLGNIVWQKIFSLNAYSYNRIVEAEDSTLYFKRTNNVLKLSASGNLLWNKNYSTGDSIKSFLLTSIISLPDGNVMVGYIDSLNLRQNLIMIKTDTSGNLLWKKRFDGSILDHALSVTELQDGTLITAGETFAEGAGWMDAFIMKTDHLGNFKWLKTYGDTSSNSGRSIVKTAEGDLILTGHTYLTYSGPYNSNALLIKTDTSGVPYFMKSYGDTLEQEGYYTLVAKDSGYIILGTSGINGMRGWLYKTDKFGYNNCFQRNESFFIDTPIFIERSFPLVITSIPTSTYTIPVTMSSPKIIAQEYCYSVEIEESKKYQKSIFIYPNPSDGRFNIEGLHGGENIEIRDISEMLIYKKIVLSDIELIDLSIKPKGMYIISVFFKEKETERAILILQ